VTTLGGSFFIYNGIELDFCFEAVIECCLELCDQVVIMDCGSTDGTVNRLIEIMSKNPKMGVIVGDWNKDKTNRKFEDLSREVISHLTTDWHIQLQADEVLHESAFDLVRILIESKTVDAYGMRRINLWRDYDTCIRFDSPLKPCDDVGVRLARRSMAPSMDGNSDDNLKCSGLVSPHYIDQLPIYHYGMVRDRMKLAKKVVDVQTGHFGDADPRVVQALENHVYKHSTFPWDAYTMPMPGTHPKFAKEWLSRKRRTS
jgi:hypothetical protein